MHNQDKRPSLTRFNSNVYLVEEDKVITDGDSAEDNKSCFRSCCCFNGFFWCGIGFIYFFILLPTGLLLLIFGFNNSHLLSLCLGTMVILMSTCGMPAAIYGCRWWRRNRRFRRRSSAIKTGTPPMGVGTPPMAGAGGKTSLVHNEQHNVSMITPHPAVTTVIAPNAAMGTVIHQSPHVGTVIQQGVLATVIQPVGPGVGGGVVGGGATVIQQSVAGHRVIRQI